MFRTLAAVGILIGTNAQAQPDTRYYGDITWNCAFFNECQQGTACRDTDLRLSIGYQDNESSLAEVWFPISERNPNADATWGVLSQREEDGMFHISGIREVGRNGESSYAISISPGGWTVMTSHEQAIGALAAVTNYGECRQVGN
jgi:hypothetical protein